MALLLTTFSGGTALAHAELVRADPAPDAVVSTPPATVRLSFSEPIDAPPDALTVVGPDGRRVDRGDARVAPDDATALQASLEASAPGSYTVRWRVISADSHPVSGAYRFSVGAPSATAGPAESAEATSGVPWQATARWVHLVGLILALGPILFGLVTVGPLVDPPLHQRLWRLSWWGTLVLLLAAPLLLVAQAVAIGGLSDAVQPEMLRSLLSSRWGALWTARLGIVVLLLALAARPFDATAPPAQRRYLVGLALGAPLLVLTSLNGHPASTDPIWLSVLIDGIHLMATAAWIGGLVAVGLALLPAMCQWPEPERLRILGHVVPRFSTLALVSVEVLILTGLYQTWAHVDRPAALTATGYGQALLVKLGLVVVVLGVAAVNLLAIRPRLAAAAQSKAPSDRTAPLVRRFGRLVGAETLLGIAILAVVGILTALPPARSATTTPVQQAAPAAPAVTLAQNAGPALVTLAIDPAGLGPNRLVVTLQDPGGASIADARVRVRTIRPGATSGASTVTTMAAEDGRYRATVSLAPAGRWRLEVLVARPGQAESMAPFELTVPVLGAKELLVLADQAMNQLQSLVEDNELSSGGPMVKTRYEFRAPDRMHFRVESSGSVAETYAIGTQRYDRRDGGAWETNPWPTAGGFRWPDYRFAESASEVTLLGRESVQGAECFVVSFLDARSGARYRIWIGTQDHRVHQYVMMATGHYMTSTFSDFNEPLDIQAPVGGR